MRKEDEEPVFPEPLDAESPEKNAAEPSSETVQVLHGVLGLFTTPEIGPETEQEVKNRRELNDVVHKMLVLGIVLSTSVLFAGLALSAITHQHVPSQVTGLHKIIKGLKTLSPPSVLSLGILLLIATPVLRVFGSLLEFIVKRDWRFVAITSVVLLILGFSLYYGKG